MHAYVFNISLSEKIVLKGRITHIEGDDDMVKSGYSLSSSYAMKRALYIGNVLLTVLNKKIKMNNVQNLDVINEIELP